MKAKLKHLYLDEISVWVICKQKRKSKNLRNSGKDFNWSNLKASSQKGEKSEKYQK